MKRFIKCLAILTILMTTVPTSLLAGTRELLLSAAIPGLGQLYGGDKVKGLSFMGAEILALHLYFNNLSMYNSLCQDTENIQDQMRIETYSSYEDMFILQAEWQQAYEKADERKGMIMPLMAAAAGVWAFNLLDLVLWPPQAKGSEALPGDEQGNLGDALQYSVVQKNNLPHVMVTYTF